MLFVGGGLFFGEAAVAAALQPFIEMTWIIEQRVVDVEAEGVAVAVNQEGIYAGSSWVAGSSGKSSARALK